MVVDVIRHIAVGFDAHHVAGFIFGRIVDQFDELLGLTGTLYAHNQSDHNYHSCFLKSWDGMRGLMLY